MKLIKILKKLFKTNVDERPKPVVPSGGGPLDVHNIIMPSDNEKTLNSGDTTCTLADGILTVSGKGKMADVYVGFIEPAEWSKIHTVIIEPGVLNIGDYAFADLSSLKTVVIPDSVIEIGIGAFKNCNKLTNLSLPDSVKCIYEDAFAGCVSLDDINLENFLNNANNGIVAQLDY